MKTTYSDKLRNPLWQKKRLEILQRDKFTCQICNDKETELHVHHKEYEYGRDPWEYDNDNFIAYCKHCHAIVEANKKNAYIILVNVIKVKMSEDWDLRLVAIFATDDGDFEIAFYRYYYGKLEPELITSDKTIKAIAKFISKPKKTKSDAKQNAKRLDCQ